MSAVKTVFAIACLVAELLFFIGIIFLISDLFGLRFVITPTMEDDLMLLAPYVRETLVSYAPVFCIGLLGVIANFVLVSRIEYRAAWFLKVTRVISWLWLPLIPIGTLVGIVLLRSTRHAAKQGSGAD